MVDNFVLRLSCFVLESRISTSNEEALIYDSHSTVWLKNIKLLLRMDVHADSFEICFVFFVIAKKMY